MKSPPGNLNNPFESSVSLPFLFARLAGSACAIGAVASGNPWLQWASVAVLAWFLTVIWGRHVLFIDNLNGIPVLGPAAIPESPVPIVSLIVPVRNEASGVEPAMRALAALDYPGIEILVIDDHSTDATPEILHRLAREFPHLRILSAPDVPEGWTGKTHASWFGFQQASPSARWLLFTDARVMFHPAAVSSAIAHAEANQLGFLSCILRFDGHSLIEEWVAVLQNRGLVLSARAFGGGAPAIPFGLGAFSLIRRDVYAAIGGHAGFPNHPIEDFMLANAALQSGAAVSAANAAALLSIRRYQGVADVRRRVVRTIRLAAGDRVIDLANRISLEFSFSVLPPLLGIGSVLRMLLDGSFQMGLAMISLLAALSYLAGSCTPRNSRRICRVRSSAAWLYPLGAVVSIGLLLLAIMDRLRGQSISWRGRTIESPAPPATAARPL